MSAATSRQLGAQLVAAAILGTAACPPAWGAEASAPPPASSPTSSAPTQVITDIAQWHHPTKAVFDKYKVAVTKVSIQDKKATFWVKLPFDPQTQPNAALLENFCLEVLRANGHWSYAMISEEDNVEIHVDADRQTHRVSISTGRP